MHELHDEHSTQEVLGIGMTEESNESMTHLAEFMLVLARLKLGPEMWLRLIWRKDDFTIMAFPDTIDSLEEVVRRANRRKNE